MIGLKGPCLGDIGSPIILKHNNTNQFGGWFSYSYGCAEPNFPAVFTEFQPDENSVIYRQYQKLKANKML